MKHEIIKDKNGKTSSKRVAGMIVSFMGLSMHIAIGLCSFFFELADPGTASGSATVLLGFGCGLLGVSVVEFLRNER